MPRYELRFRRMSDKCLQSITFDAASACDALTMIPRHPPASQHQLWCDDKLLFSIARAAPDADSFWVITADYPA